MGQYYRPAILKKNWKTAKGNPVCASLLCYDFNNGAKLMEHSYIGNWLVRSVEYLLANQFKGYPFVWVGDYADKVSTKTGEHDLYHDANLFIYKDYEGDSDKKSQQYIKLRGSIPVMYQGDRWCSNPVFDPYMNYPYYRYLVNYSKKEYCIMPKYSKNDEGRINPLPILTSSGCGRGCGDFHRGDELVGTWAFDCIGLTNSKKEVEGFTEINGKFVE